MTYRMYECAAQIMVSLLRLTAELWICQRSGPIGFPGGRIIQPNVLSDGASTKILRFVREKMLKNLEVITARKHFRQHQFCGEGILSGEMGKRFNLSSKCLKIPNLADSLPDRQTEPSNVPQQRNFQTADKFWTCWQLGRGREDWLPSLKYVSEFVMISGLWTPFPFVHIWCYVRELFICKFQQLSNPLPQCRHYMYMVPIGGLGWADWDLAKKIFGRWQRGRERDGVKGFWYRGCHLTRAKWGNYLVSYLSGYQATLLLERNSFHVILCYISHHYLPSPWDRHWQHCGTEGGGEMDEECLRRLVWSGQGGKAQTMYLIHKRIRPRKFST